MLVALPLASAACGNKAESAKWRVEARTASIRDVPVPVMPGYAGPSNIRLLEVPVTITYLGVSGPVTRPPVSLYLGDTSSTQIPLEATVLEATVEFSRAASRSTSLGLLTRVGEVMDTIETGEEFRLGLAFRIGGTPPANVVLVFGDVPPLTVRVSGGSGAVTRRPPRRVRFEPPPSSFSSGSVPFGDDGASRLVARVTPAFFGAPPQQPHLGRGFTAGDYAGGEPVTILSHAHWTTAYASDPGVIGRSIRIDGVPRTVVGVMPPGVDTPSGVAAWVPGP